jgi:hypothetical protein
LTSQSKNPHAVFLKSIKRPIDRGVLDLDDLLLGRQAKLSVFYAPLDSVNTGAKVVLLGLTPGWQQMKIAIDTYCVERSKGRCDGQAQAAAKDAASFAGMRKRIVIWLDTLGLHHKLGECHLLLSSSRIVRYYTRRRSFDIQSLSDRITQITGVTRPSRKRVRCFGSW